MQLHVTPQINFREKLAQADRSLVGLWVSSANPLNAEIVAGSGTDWILIDGEHSPLDLGTLVNILYAVSRFPVVPVVRLPTADPVLIKQYLDLGAQNLLLPMIDTPSDAEEAVAAIRFPPRGVRGVGSALARSGQFNRIPDYVLDADKYISLTVQIESRIAVENASQIVQIDGVDAIFIGPSDLAASMGLIGQQDHQEVVAAVEEVIKTAKAAHIPVGVNAFKPELAQHYRTLGADFVAIGADVTVLATGTEKLVRDWN